VQFLWGELGPHLTQCRLGRGLPQYQAASSSIQPFGHNRHRPKIGGSTGFLGRGLGPHLTQSCLVEANLHTKCHLDAYNRLDTTEMGQKLGRGSAPFLGKADESPSSTTWPGIRPISEKSAHLTARPKPHCLRWGPSSPPPKGRSPQFLAHICCGQMAG